MSDGIICGRSPIEFSLGGLRYYVWNQQVDNRQHPVVLFTHGAGSRGSDRNLIVRHPVISKMLPLLGDAILIAPQCAKDTWFDSFEHLIGLTEKIASCPDIDQSRIYGTGVSMGGYAMLQLMQSCPELFAAGLICCGGGMYWNAERLKRIPLRLFHGEDDTVVYPAESRYMAEKINACGGSASLTIYPDCDHNCWDRTFENAENLKWLMSQIKKENQYAAI